MPIAGYPYWLTKIFSVCFFQKSCSISFLIFIVLELNLQYLIGPPLVTLQTFYLNFFWQFLEALYSF